MHVVCSFIVIRVASIITLSLHTNKYYAPNIVNHISTKVILWHIPTKHLKSVLLLQLNRFSRSISTYVWNTIVILFVD